MALYADAQVSRALREQVLSLCRRRNASLVLLAPAEQALAASIIVALLPALAQAGIDWNVVPLEGDPVGAARAYLASHAGIEYIACDGCSGLAQSVYDNRLARHRLPAPILISLIVEPRTGASRFGTSDEIDWLRPELNRGI